MVKRRNVKVNGRGKHGDGEGEVSSRHSDSDSDVTSIMVGSGSNEGQESDFDRATEPGEPEGSGTGGAAIGRPNQQTGLGDVPAGRPDQATISREREVLMEEVRRNAPAAAQNRGDANREDHRGREQGAGEGTDVEKQRVRQEGIAANDIKTAFQEIAASITTSIRESNRELQQYIRETNREFAHTIYNAVQPEHRQTALQHGRDLSMREMHRNQREVPNRRRRGRNWRETSSTTGGESEGEGLDYNNQYASSSSGRRGTTGRWRRESKLPVFTGKESWTVWFNRFTEMADRRGWSLEDRLDEMLPKLHGVAGEFVYDQLNRDVRSRYNLLVEELNNRFRVVETTKTYKAQFSRRTQKPSETVEDFAAELKRLYDKAHPSRDSETRREDLLQRFLDGLIDDKARFQVEYVKEPRNIDEAVYQVVDLQETRKCPRKPEFIGERKMKRTARVAAVSASSSDESEEENASGAKAESQQRVADSGEHKPIRKAYSKPKTLNGANSKEKVDTGSQELANKLEDLMKKIESLQDQVKQVSENKLKEPYKPRDRPQYRKLEDVQCYSCKQFGHYSRNCDNSWRNCERAKEQAFIRQGQGQGQRDQRNLQPSHTASKQAGPTVQQPSDRQLN